ncbi:SH3 domain-containing protein [Hymenobacter pini]|uniref:SH3 domain-containing protein n=1 Tax=Hymenobacter pini TaxID=2880879 RepID=UPI001CF595BA|nr:SH3 domain-containing protein [Hymenobacter pini]MCA8833096.1 SH3 domain-containing protein [Hymenobacter pini]
MKRTLLSLFVLAALASCSASKDESRSNRTNTTPVPHNTVVECILYDGMTKDSRQLATINSGNEVQVMDTVDAYFVKVRVTTNGQTQNGYMYRNCFSKN